MSKITASYSARRGEKKGTTTQTGAAPAPLIAGVVPARGAPLLDTRARSLHDLRISVTDRCNFRCTYCMPKEIFGSSHHFMPRAEMLTFEEITQLARVFVQLGVRKLRLTGGEPLVRKGVEDLIAQLAAIQTDDGTPLDITLTTNGSLLERKAKALARAGLKRVTVSLDSLNDEVFRSINDVDFPVTKVLAGIEAAQAAGLAPIKVNMVVKRGTNDHEILPMARHFRGSGIALRFIEFMDVGASNGWRMDEVLPGAEIIKRLQSEFPLVPLGASAPGETAARWGYANANGVHDPALGEVGTICSVTQAFCGSCNRARLSTDGKLFTCLFANHGHDLRTLVRDGASDDDIAGAIAGIWRPRDDHYSELRASMSPELRHDADRIEMSYIGG